jgi:hypothetical protein
MAANTDPIFPLTPKASFATLTAANTAKDGTGVTAQIVAAGANGAYVESIRCQPLGTNVASVLRIFLNNGGSSAVASNNSLWYEVALPVTTLTETNKMLATDILLTLNRAIPSGYKLLACLGTAVAAGWQVTGNSGDY